VESHPSNDDWGTRLSERIFLRAYLPQSISSSERIFIRAYLHQSVSSSERIFVSAHLASGATLGAVRRAFMSPSPVAFPARFLKNSVAVSTTPTFSATAAAIHWFNDTPFSFASR